MISTAPSAPSLSTVAETLWNGLGSQWRDTAIVERKGSTLTFRSR